jgi:hypothetical protein
VSLIASPGARHDLPVSGQGLPAERRQIIDDFTAEVFAGLDPSPARFARWAAGADLPGDPSPEQVEA